MKRLILDQFKLAEFTTINKDTLPSLQLQNYRINNTIFNKS